MARKIELAKWEPDRELEPDQIAAGAVTANLRDLSSNTTLSVWECDADLEDISQVVIALASTMKRSSKIDVALLSRADLENDGFAFKNTLGATRVADLAERHYDIIGFELGRLCNLAFRIADCVRNGGECHRFSERRVKELLADAVRGGRLQLGDLEISLRESVATLLDPQ